MPETEPIVPAEAHVLCQTITEVADRINIAGVQHLEAVPIAEERRVPRIGAATGVHLHVDLYIPDLTVPREVRDTEVRVEVLQGVPVTDQAEVLQGVPVTAPAGVVLPEVQDFVLPAEAVPGVLVV